MCASSKGIFRNAQLSDKKIDYTVYFRLGLMDLVILKFMYGLYLSCVVTYVFAFNRLESCIRFTF